MFVALGTIILFVAWLFFNAGSTGDMFAVRTNGVPKIMMNTIISGAAGGLISVLVKPLIHKTYGDHMNYDIIALCNGILAGLVSITGACNNVQPWAALIIGIIGGVVFSLGSRLCINLNIDDPIDASAVHGMTGMWGLIAVGLFDNTKGIFYGSEDAGIRWKFLGVQVLGMVCILAWVATLSLIFFISAKKSQSFRVTVT